MSAWDLKNGFTEQLGSGVYIRWSQLQRTYYAAKGSHLIGTDTNLGRLRKQAKFYA